MIVLTCEWCGVEFRRSPCEAAAARYCSNTCRYKAKRLKTRICKMCGVSFRPESGQRNTVRYCSKSCRMAARSKRRRRVTKRCEACRKPFEVCWCHRHIRFCSIACSVVVRRHCRWPEPEQLRRLVQYLTLTKIGELYGVTQSAVQYWAKCYNIVVPRRKLKSSRAPSRVSGYVGEAYGV